MNRSTNIISNLSLLQFDENFLLQVVHMSCMHLLAGTPWRNLPIKHNTEQTSNPGQFLRRSCTVPIKGQRKDENFLLQNSTHKLDAFASWEDSKKDSSFFPTGMQMCILPQLLPKMQCFPSPQILSHLYVGKDSSTFKVQNSHKSFPTIFSFFFHLFLFIYIFLYFIFITSFKSFLSFFFVPENFKFFPKVEKLFPSIWGQ